MSHIRTLVTFQSNVVNMTETNDDLINTCCFGDDLAQWLMQRLQQRGIETDTEPGQEDFGWYFGFEIGPIDYDFVITHRPGDESEPGMWIGIVERQAGLLASLFGARKRGIAPHAVRILHEALSTSQEVSGVRWHHRRDFDAGREENGKPDPTA